MNYWKSKVIPRLPALDRKLRILSNGLADSYNKLRHYIVTKTIKQDIKEIRIPLHYSFPTKIFNASDLPIYIFWWQGELNMPPIVRACFNSLKANAGRHPIYLITKENILEFISKQTIIPFDSIIFEWQNKNIINLAHFSDLLRSWLLYNFGGIWVDATLFFTNEIDSILKNNFFYTRKLNYSSSNYNYFIAYKGWSCYFWFSQPENYCFKFLYESLYLIIKKNKGLYEYFTFDYILNILYQESESFKTMIDNLPSVKRPSLLNNLNAPFSGLQDLLNESSSFYKLSYKGQYNKFTKDGKPTWYKYITDTYN